MSTWTWTFVRIDKLTKEQTEWCLKHVKWITSSQTYARYSKMKWEDALKDWIDMHNEDYDYFVNECGVDPKKMTPEYLEKELKQKLKKFEFRQKCYDACLEGKMTLEEVLVKTNQLNNKYNDFYIIKRQGHYYVNINHEIFRNQLDSEKEFCTVEDLINELKTSSLITDFTDDTAERGPLNSALENKIRNYYEAIGDNNFYVHFG